MSKAPRVLGIMGSPRRNGNTHLLVSEVLKGAASEGAATDLLLLGDLDIRECDGCHACWKGKECSKRDDMNAVYPRLIESDVVVFGTPVYWYGPTALMKGFIDRFVYFNCPENRAKIRGKTAALVVPFEETDPETVAPVEAFFEKCLAYLETELSARLIAPGVTRRGEVADDPKLMEQALALGKALAMVDTLRASVQARKRERLRSLSGRVTIVENWRELEEAETEESLSVADRAVVEAPEGVRLTRV
jgi:multimeric flavodoxin WrbA